MKNKFLTSIIFIGLFSCKIDSPKSKTIDNKNIIVNQFFEYFNKHEFGKMASLYTDTAYFKDPTLGVGIVKQTQQQTQKKYEDLQNAFPDIKDEIVKIYNTADSTIVVEFISKGTAPDATKFELPICTIFTIENGKITKDFTYFDNF